MEAQDRVERARAVLMRLRDQLVEHQQQYPHPHTLVPAENATLFNETIAELEDMFGASWVTNLSISRWAIVPASFRASGSPVIPSVGREVLLGHLRQALRRLEHDTPLPTPTARVMPHPSAVAAARFLTSGPPRSSPPPSTTEGTVAPLDPGNA